MNRIRKRELRERRSAQQLMGITQLTEHGVVTPGGELEFIMLQPDNLSVLSDEGVLSRVRALAGVLQSVDSIHLMAMDSRESFQSNRDWYRQRRKEEPVPAVQKLLEQDVEHLDAVQASTVSTREFALIVPAEKTSAEDAGSLGARLEKMLRDRGFRARLAQTRDLRRILSVYYLQDATATLPPNFFDRKAESAPKEPQKKKGGPAKAAPIPQPKGFLDRIAPTAVKFNTENYVLGGSYRCALAIRDYPPTTAQLALLRHLGEKSGVTIHIYLRPVAPAEERAMLHNASNKSRLEQSNASNMVQSVTAAADLQNMADMINALNRSREPLLHCAVFLELAAKTADKLRALSDEVQTELQRSKLGADRLFLRQLEGFISVNPAGHNAFGSQFELALPASSAANLYPFNYSGKTDPHGFFIGRAVAGTNIIVDLDRRAGDKTNANALILGNSGQGKSYLLKLLLCNSREAGKSVIALDPEHELTDLSKDLGGCFIDLMEGRHYINPLEPKTWGGDGGEDSEEDGDAPAAFRQSSGLAQHITFLKDFFRAYKDFSDRHIDVIELMLERLYRRWGLTDRTDFSALPPTAFPILSDLYQLMEDVFQNYDREPDPLYSKTLLREVLLGLHSMCRGADAKFFNGHTNVTADRFLAFGVKSLINARGGIKNALLFNTLSYISDRLLTEGSTVAALDELYLFLSIPIAIEYIRNFMKRVRKKDSSVLLASQNLEDFTQPGLAELTRPLFSIPTHQFIFNGGAVDRQFYMDNLQLTASEFELIRYPQLGVCLYKCGNERYQLEVKAPKYKSDLFGTGGGK